MLNQRALVYIESEKDLSLPTGWEVKKQSHAGNVQIMLIALEEKEE